MTILILLLLVTTSAFAEVGPVPHNLTPREVMIEVIRANERLDYTGIERLMAKDTDIANYSIAGKKYVGWQQLGVDLTTEFRELEKLEITIRELKVKANEEKGYAVFSMEIDYIRYVGRGDQQVRHFLPLRETGLLEKRKGEWILVYWHESQRFMTGTEQDKKANGNVKLSDMKGQWMIEEVDRFYCITFDEKGNGPYNWQNGKIKTIEFNGHNWIGHWHQSGNDREGGFEIALSADAQTARGKWWYERVDTRKPEPRQFGGDYFWSRMKIGATCDK